MDKAVLEQIAAMESIDVDGKKYLRQSFLACHS